MLINFFLNELLLILSFKDIIISLFFTFKSLFAIIRIVNKFVAYIEIKQSTIIKIVVATILSYTVLGIKGVWIAYAVYCIAQKHLSKHKYLDIEKQNKQISIMDS